MMSAFQYRRLLTFGVLLAAAFVGLGFRLYHLQVDRHHLSRGLVDESTTRMVTREPRRGDIFDSRGNLLATSRFVKTVCADPSLIGTNQMILAQALAPLLALPEAELLEKLRTHSWVDKAGELHIDQYVVLKRKVLEEEWQQIRGVLSNLVIHPQEKSLPRNQQAFYSALRQRAIFADPVEDQLRIYPNGRLAAHVLGYTVSAERATTQGRVMESSGVMGIEQRCDQTLTGARGWREMVTDRRRRELVTFREADVAPRPGLDVVLTLDLGVQEILEDELLAAVLKHSPLNATAMVVEPSTGRVLAMANWPSFDPNQPGKEAAAPETYMNRCIAAVAEPGSTFKLVVVSGALNEKLLALDDRLDCENGAFAFQGLTLHDHHRYGTLSVEEIIAKSSNIGAAKIGLKLGARRLHDYVRAFGFGETTQIPLPGEVRGLVRPLDQWSKVSTAWIPMGHEIATTPLQMTMAMAAVANGGELMRPWLVERIVGDDGRVAAQYAPQAVRRVMSAEAARQMTRALLSAVQTNGTGLAAALEDYAVAGKTGTAQKIVGGRYSNTHYYSSFIGFFPASQPSLCISVMLDDPQHGSYGGETAAPVFRRIGERAAAYLGVRSNSIQVAAPEQSAAVLPPSRHEALGQSPPPPTARFKDQEKVAKVAHAGRGRNH